jgi:hypothetical protein
LLEDLNERSKSLGKKSLRKITQLAIQLLFEQPNGSFGPLLVLSLLLAFGRGRYKPNNTVAWIVSARGVQKGAWVTSYAT